MVRKRGFLFSFTSVLLCLLVIFTMVPADAFASDYYCEGCGWSFAYLESEGVWHCDDCNYCYWCIQGGDGPYHCVACDGCDVEVCENCSDSHVSGDGNFGLCKDCAQSMGYHCECGNCYEDYWHCDTCGLCRECIDNGSEPLHCAGCGSCTNDICEDCSNEMVGGEWGVCVDCALDRGYHCQLCGGCFTSEVDHCEDNEDGACLDCCIALGYHCDECGDHVFNWCEASGEFGGHCRDCSEASEEYAVCEVCGEVYCDFCSMGPTFDRDENICEDCIDANDLWCPECEVVEMNLEWCPDGGSHCVNCCDNWLCNQCGICMEGAGIAMCDDCGLCVECCQENIESEGDPCGEYCVESSEFEEHFCEECGNFFCEIDRCDDCGLCVDCCADKSDCSDGMCVEDSEYEYHFCLECGECFHDVDPCDDCITAGEQLCRDCCAQRSEALGCDHGICMSSWEWDEHWCPEHECCFEDCDDDPEIHTHVFGADGICAVCGQTEDGRPVIAAQPQDAKCALRDPEIEYDEDMMPVVNFYIRARGENLHYEWLYYRDGGAERSYIDDGYGCVENEKPKLSYYVPTDGCWNTEDHTIICRVWNANGEVWSDPVRVLQDHVYGTEWKSYSDPTEPAGKYVLTYTADSQGNIASSIVGLEGLNKQTHRRYCRGEGCTHFIEEPCVWTAWETMQAPTSFIAGYAQRSCINCGAVQYKQLGKISLHLHNWQTGPDAANTGMHSSVCSVCGQKKDIAPHTYSEWTEISAPSEDKTGLRRRTCTVCGYEQEEAVPRLDHRHGYHFDPETGNYTKTYKTTFEYTYMTQSGVPSDQYHFEKCLVKVDGTVCGYIDPKSAKAHEFNEGWKLDDSTGQLSRSCHLCGYTQIWSYEHDEHTYILGDSENVIYRNKYDAPIRFARAGEEVTVETTDPYASASGYWASSTMKDPYNGKSGSYTLTDEEKNKLSFTFTMPEHPVRLYWRRNAECLDLTQTYSSYADREAHYHQRFENGKWVSHLVPDPSTYEAPSCRAAGHTARYRCDICGAYAGNMSEIIPATDHTYVLDESSVVPATCISYGYSGDQVCTDCGNRLKGERTPKLEHEYSSEMTLIKEADCVHSGIYGYVCTREGCDRYQKAASIPATGHDWGEWEWVRIPTQARTGIMKRVCKHAGACEQEKEVKAGTHIEAPVETISKISFTFNLPKAGYPIYWTTQSGRQAHNFIFTPQYASDQPYLRTCATMSWDTDPAYFPDDEKFYNGHYYIGGITIEAYGLYQFPDDVGELQVDIRDVNGESYPVSADGSEERYVELERVGDNLKVTVHYRTPHSYGHPVWTLSSDRQSVTARFACTSEGLTAPDYITEGRIVSVTSSPTSCALYEFECVGPDGEIWPGFSLYSHDMALAPGKLATCEEDGCKQHYICIYCGQHFALESSVYPFADDSEWKREATGHDWGEWTDLGDGRMQRVCKNDPSHVEIKNTNTYAAGGRLRSAGDASKLVSVRVIDPSSNVVDEKSFIGNDTTYSTSGLENGDYSVEASKDGHATRSYDIQIADSDVSLDILLCLIGDVDMNGTVDAFDLQTLCNVLAGNDTLEGYQKAVADLFDDGSGDVDIMDLQTLSNILAGNE